MTVANLPARDAQLGTFVLCAGLAVAWLEPSISQIWVAAFIGDRRLSTPEVGWLASADLLLVAASMIGISAWKGRVNSRLVSVAAASLFTAGNAIAILPSTVLLVGGRLVSGAAAGALIASLTQLVVRRPDVQRTIALMWAAALALNCSIYFMLPLFVGQRGCAMLFALLAGLGALVGIILWVGAPNSSSEGVAQVERVSNKARNAPLVGCFAILGASAGIGTVNTYLIVVGTGLGFSIGSVGKMIAIIGPFTIVGPIAARILGERVGVLAPTLLGLAGIVVTGFLLTSSTSLFLLGTYTALFGIATSFYQPYGIALVNHVDPSGRVTATSQAFVLIGSAGGAKFGSAVISSSSPNFVALASVAAVCLAASAALYVISVRYSERKSLVAGKS